MRLQPKQPAFVLLYAVLVITVVLAVGLILINIITKQITLSIVGRSSQIAFYAADSGRDCLEYWGKQGVFGSSDGTTYTPPASDAPKIIQCARQSVAVNPATDSFNQTFNFFWGDTNSACSVSSIQVGGSDDLGPLTSKIISFGYNQSDGSGCPGRPSSRLVERSIVKRGVGGL